MLIKVVSIEILNMTWKENLHGTQPPKLTPGVATFLALWLEGEGAHGSAVILETFQKGGMTTLLEEIFWSGEEYSLLYNILSQRL